MPKIFISYRHADTSVESFLIAERLSNRFGKDSVFLDIHSILKGADFQKSIDVWLGDCDVLLAVIGAGWLNARSTEGQRRLDDPNDFVRIEIASALRRDIPVIPVLIDIEMSDLATGLPTDLADLAKRICISVRLGEHLKGDLKMLNRQVSKALRLPPLKSSDLLGIAVTTNGLRSFGKSDEDFFLHLLPGKCQNGLPESIHFLKTRIEGTNKGSVFRVGVIHGPTGCGKSSLVRAGLIPKLNKKKVRTFYVEASPNDTEDRLLEALPTGHESISLSAALQDALRQRRGDEKFLIVLDQFEQYLHSTLDEEQDELMEALQQCDGLNVQCILLVRDDFWTPLTRFMKRMKVPLVDLMLVESFHKRHAKKVLALLGMAYKSLPKSGVLNDEHDKFLNQAIVELADDDFVIPVRIAMFAQMMGKRKWNPEELKAVGGAKGVEMEFLETSLAVGTALNGNRRHQTAAKNILNVLVPESGISIKGAMVSKQVRLEESGYARWPKRFDELIKILDTDLKLVTPTESVFVDPEDRPAKADPKHYQLTHDYLVPPLRDWLTQKQKESRRGRAELRLADRSSHWTNKKETRHLPAWWEHVNIRLFTRTKWTQPQKAMMRAAARYHAVRFSLLTVILVIVGYVTIRTDEWVRQTEQLRFALLKADSEELPKLIEQIGLLQRLWLAPQLESTLLKPDSSGGTPEQRANAAAVLFRFGRTESIWPLLKHRGNPTLQSCLIKRLALSGSGPQQLVTQLDDEIDPSIRRALILALDAFGKDSLEPDQQEGLIAKLIGMYRDDPDPGIHGATG